MGIYNGPLALASTLATLTEITLAGQADQKWQDLQIKTWQKLEGSKETGTQGQEERKSLNLTLKHVVTQVEPVRESVGATNRVSDSSASPNYPGTYCSTNCSRDF